MKFTPRAVILLASEGTMARQSDGLGDMGLAERGDGLEVARGERGGVTGHPQTSSSESPLLRGGVVNASVTMCQTLRATLQTCNDGS